MSVKEKSYLINKALVAVSRYIAESRKNSYSLLYITVMQQWSQHGSI